MRWSPSPFLPVVGRYITGQFFGILLPIIATFVLLYVVIDLFDRLDVLLRHEATLSSSARYFLFKVPLMMTQITPPAVITSALLSFGLHSRRNEIIALRASGVSLLQTAIPIILASTVISFAVLVWNETVVPYSSRKFEYVNNVEIRKRPLRGILNDREIWYHGANGFYNIDHVDRARRMIFGMKIYRFDDAFRLLSVIEVPQAEWRAQGWKVTGAVQVQGEEREFVATPLDATDIAIPETFDDFLEVERKPEELGFTTLRRRILDLTNKGIDASHYLVDLHLKLAVPFSSLVLALIAIPIGGRLRRHPSIASIVALGMTVGFGYWVLLGLATSLGQSGALPAPLAAWAANGVYTLLAAALFLSSE